MLASVIGLYVESAKTTAARRTCSPTWPRSTSAPPPDAGCSSASSSPSRSRRRCSRCTPGCRHHRAGDPRHLGAAGQRARQDRHLRDDPLLPRAVPRGLALGDAGRGRARADLASCTARSWRSAQDDILRLIGYTSMSPLRLHRAGHLRDDQPGRRRRDPLHGQPRARARPRCSCVAGFLIKRRGSALIATSAASRRSRRCSPGCSWSPVWPTLALPGPLAVRLRDARAGRRLRAPLVGRRDRGPRHRAGRDLRALDVPAHDDRPRRGRRRRRGRPRPRPARGRRPRAAAVLALVLSASTRCRCSR